MYRKYVPLWIPLLLLAVFFVVLAVNLFYMQVIDGDKYLTISENNYVRIVKLKPLRGNIYDRKYRPVAINRTSDNLYFQLSEIKNRKDLARFISETLTLDTLDVYRVIEKNRFRRYHDIPLKKGLDQKTMIKIAENMSDFPSLKLVSEYTRHYEYPNHFTGHTGALSEKEYEKMKHEGYQLTSIIGKNGLEKQYENMLKGEYGYKLLQVDATGRDLEFLKHNLYQPAKKGLDLILSIDNDLQEYIRAAFPKNKNGAVLVTDVRTGGILAYVSMPEFDPNIFSGEISQNLWNQIIHNSRKPMLDRIASGTYPPGSIYKPIMASVGLESKVINPYTKLSYCNGGKWIGDRFFKCWDEDGHGRLNVTDAIKQSCDVFFYDLSLKLELDQIRDYTRKSHLTVKTGVDLPIEVSGFFPDEDWYYKNYGKYAAIIGPKVNLSIGQGEVLATVLEFCSYYSAIANDGLWLQPHFLEGFIEKERVQVSGYKTDQLPIEADNLKVIQEALRKACNEPHGTGLAATSRKYTVYGKTGSAENHMGKNTHAWFAGYAEWEEPEIAFTVMIENAGHGGSVAAPFAGKFLRFYNDLRAGNMEKCLERLEKERKNG